MGPQRSGLQPILEMKEKGVQICEKGRGRLISTVSTLRGPSGKKIITLPGGKGKQCSFGERYKKGVRLRDAGMSSALLSHLERG